MESTKQSMGVEKSSLESKLKSESKISEKLESKSSETDSSISLTFDSASDCGYKSGEIFSVHTSPNKCSSDLSISDSHLPPQKLDQNITYDSGLVSDCFSHSTENVSSEKLEALERFTYEETSKNKDKYQLQDIFCQDKDGDTIVHLAIVEARSDVIYPLIQLAPHPDFLDITNDLFQTLLHLATLTGKSNIVRRLVVAGATLDFQDHKGNIPLHIASRRGDLDCVQAMLATITESDAEEANCSYQIYLQQHDLSYLINIKNYDGQSCVHLAAAGGFLKVMECLYNNNGNINDQDGKTGRTALHYAVENGNLKLVELLLTKCHADPRVRSYAGRTAVRTAYALRKRNPSKTRQDIFNLLYTPIDSLESSSDLESDSSSDEVDIESLLHNSRDLSARRGC
ncbi:NF-kappa-B inhibitor cactus [Caerostris extrusa]|uniref:NF-kappa-B inhibitor cactus n=1 Tax=Caerostris extrusa TaxID=172846 RepID=A0AAV4V873_CAEEX|nr:NF-kappa-B inhibitor cactus [Caerostris extrusa]